MKNSVLVAMSGGIDSCTAAALMLEEGYNCSGFTLKLFNGSSADGVNSSSQDMADAASSALHLGIPHTVLDFTGEFDRQVIQRFIGIYGNGATPNPCIFCNPNIKFNLELLQKHLGYFDCLVTGHYARVEHDAGSGRYLLRKAFDNKKDQSYVLYGLSQTQLEKARFPLGSLTKLQVRKIAAEKKLINNEKAESQDICFVLNGNYGDFIESYTGRTWPPGNIIDTEGRILGRHKGIIRYTIGQRRGLGVASGSHFYVAAKSTAENTVTLAPDSCLYSKSLTAGNINLIACVRMEKSMRVKVKTRYLQNEQPAFAEQTGENEIYIEFDSPQRAVTPGQSAVMYDGDTVIGGGIIC